MYEANDEFGAGILRSVGEEFLVLLLQKTALVIAVIFRHQCNRPTPRGKATFAGVRVQTGIASDSSGLRRLDWREEEGSGGIAGGETRDQEFSRSRKS